MRIPDHFIAVRNELNKYNNTGAEALDYIYHMPLK